MAERLGCWLTQSRDWLASFWNAQPCPSLFVETKSVRSSGSNAASILFILLGTHSQTETAFATGDNQDHKLIITAISSKQSDTVSYFWCDNKKKSSWGVQFNVWRDQPATFAHFHKSCKEWLDKSEGKLLTQVTKNVSQMGRNFWYEYAYFAEI